MNIHINKLDIKKSTPSYFRGMAFFFFLNECLILENSFSSPINHFNKHTCLKLYKIEVKRPGKGLWQVATSMDLGLHPKHNVFTVHLYYNDQ